MPAIPAMPEFSAHQRKHLVNFVHRLFNQITETPHKELVRELGANARGMIDALAEAGALTPQEKDGLLEVHHRITQDAFERVFEDALRDNPNMLDD